MIVEFAAGRAKNVVLRHYLVDDIVKKYLFFLRKSHFRPLKIKNVGFFQVFPSIIPIRSMLVEFAPGTMKNEVWGLYSVHVFPRCRSLCPKKSRKPEYAYFQTINNFPIYLSAMSLRENCHMSKIVHILSSLTFWDKCFFIQYFFLLKKNKENHLFCNTKHNIICLFYLY